MLESVGLHLLELRGFNVDVFGKLASREILSDVVPEVLGIVLATAEYDATG